VKTFGAVTAAADVSVSIEEGTVVGLIGGNGAGKTTFINLVTGYLTPTSGTIHYMGRDITGRAPREVTRLGVCRSFQIPQVFDTLTARENLLVGTAILARAGARFAGGAGASAGDAAADEMLQRFRLDAWRDLPASALPEGVRKLLDIAMATVHSPRLLLLDEPTSGISVEEKFAIMDVIMGALREQRRAVMFVEHDMEIIRRYTHRVLAFYEGRIIADGAPADVFDHAEVKRYVVGGAVAAPAREGSC
jgi:branched-chain amino acid transport system ATP-binding protein